MKRSVQHLRDESLAAAALDKLRRSETPTAQEAAALDRVKERKDAADREQLIAAVPKGVYAEWAETQQKVLNEQGPRYDLPIGKGNKTIDVREVLARFHQILAENKHRLRTADDDDGEDIQAELDKAKLEDLTESARGRALKNAALARESLPIDYILDGFRLIQTALRNLGDRLPRQIEGDPGRVAHQMLEDTWDDCERQIARHFGLELLDDQSPADEKPADAD